jgi:hypothetical protein
VPRYEVTVQGRGILLRLRSEAAVGFLRIVHVRARNTVEAERQAMRIVRQQWDASSHATANQGAAPYLTIDTIGVLSFWHRLLGFPRGYIFFSADGVQAPADPPAGRR